MRPIHEILKDKLKDIEPKMTSRALAKAVGISPVYICQILSGEQLPPPPVFAKIISSLNFSAEEMRSLFNRYKETKYPELMFVDYIFSKTYLEQYKKEKPISKETQDSKKLTREAGLKNFDAAMKKALENYHQSKLIGKKP